MEAPGKARMTMLEKTMNIETREKYMRWALVSIGIIFFFIYPLGYLWPSGWVWHDGEGVYYLQMIAGVYAVLGGFLIAASRNPNANRSLILFTIWSSIVHAGIMGWQAMFDQGEQGHLMGDVPALLLVAFLLWYLLPSGKVAG